MSCLAKLGIFAAYVVTACITVLTTLVSAQWIEREYLPVVINAHVMSVTHTKSSVIIHGVIDKVRDCRFVELLAYHGDQLLTTRFIENEDVHSKLTRAIGPQHFGPIEVSQDVPFISLYVRNECHPLWQTTTLIINDLKI